MIEWRAQFTTQEKYHALSKSPEWQKLPSFGVFSSRSQNTNLTLCPWLIIKLYFHPGKMDFWYGWLLYKGIIQNKVNYSTSKNDCLLLKWDSYCFSFYCWQIIICWFASLDYMKMLAYTEANLWHPCCLAFSRFVPGDHIVWSCAETAIICIEHLFRTTKLL